MKFELGPDLVIDSDDTRVQQQGLRIAVIGQSGAGKSWTIALLAEQALEQRLPVVIVDPHGEYYTLAEVYPQVLIVGGDNGDLPLAEEAVGELGRVDLLLVPVGGGTALGARAAAGLVRALEPRVVIPMHYRTESGGANLEPVVNFLKEMGAEEAVPQPRLSISRVSLPAETRLILLDYRR